MRTKIGSVCIAAFLVFTLSQCNNPQTQQPTNETSLQALQAFPINTSRPKGYKGKILPKTPLTDTYTPAKPPILTFPEIDASLSIALLDQLKLLKRRKQAQQQTVGGLDISLDQLKLAIETLVYTRNEKPDLITDELDTYQLKGKDGKGNVYFTGYYTPIIKVAARPSQQFPYPIYTQPDRAKWKNGYPSRKEIDGDGVLEGQGLELAYAQSLVDIYYMQLQGSGIVQYPSGKQEYLSFTGANGHSYRSIETYLMRRKDLKIGDISIAGVKRFLLRHPELEETILFSNPSYVFFDRKRAEPHGAGHVPLAAGISIAVDQDYIPLGSCFLAAIPQLNKQGDFSHHEYRILLAQDLGGAIRGSGHVDIYCGIGKQAEAKAMSFHQYGQLWLLLPKEHTQHKAGWLSLYE